MSNLTNEQIERNFAELNPLMSHAEALAEANRCLYCYDAPCMHACPTHIDVPSFIKKIATGNLKGSARVIFDANPIGSTCARVCPVEALCEGACVEKTLVQKPIEIGRLQRYATEKVLVESTPLFEVGAPNGFSIGIVGSGPAGLSCAAYLARLGYAATVYERRARPGGLDTYGMAEYKMTRSVSLAEVGLIEQMGVKFVTETSVVADDNDDVKDSLTAGEIRTRHNAILIAAGLGATNLLNIPGEDLEGVIDALTFIEQVKTRDWNAVPLGSTVAVIGAGNTAVDAATQAKRLGAAKVMMVYRRTEADAPAYEYELELARLDGIEFHWQTTPVEITGNGKVAGLRCSTVDGDEAIIECDQVIKAIGQAKLGTSLSEAFEIDIDEKGRVRVDDDMRTSDPMIFAAGDCVSGGAEAVDAAQMGKLAAIGIHRSLTGERVEFAGSGVSK
ncbi:MAG: NAD(P)-dependent oxidoreductase [Acidobacteria bacterium]|nr:NAD(P)-dependent oxidoreductase [Acidobacteriota bacterium]